MAIITVPYAHNFTIWEATGFGMFFAVARFLAFPPTASATNISRLREKTCSWNVQPLVFHVISPKPPKHGQFRVVSSGQASTQGLSREAEISFSPRRPYFASEPSAATMVRLAFAYSAAVQDIKCLRVSVSSCKIPSVSTQIYLSPRRCTTAMASWIVRGRGWRRSAPGSHNAFKFCRVVLNMSVPLQT
jgi:hypothetical protein